MRADRRFCLMRHTLRNQPERRSKHARLLISEMRHDLPISRSELVIWLLLLACSIGFGIAVLYLDAPRRYW